MKLFIGVLTGTALVLSQGALATEFTHEPIHVVCTEVHGEVILEAGIDQKAGYFGLMARGGEVDVHHDIHELIGSLEQSTVTVMAQNFPQGPGLKSFTAVGVQNHFAY